MGRSILAVVVGFVVWSVVWVGAGVVAVPLVFGAENVANEEGRFVHTGALATLVVLSVVCSLVAGAVCGLIAKRGTPAPAWLAGLLLAVGVTLEGMSWGLAPAWYHIAFLVLLVPATLAGAAIVRKKA